MDIQFYGANCISLSIQGVRVVVDDNLAELGGKPVIKPGDIALFTSSKHEDIKVETKLTIDCPGEYEVSSMSVYGVPARAHIEADEKKAEATIYKITGGGMSVVVVGHIYPKLSDDLLEKIGLVDVLVVPVGGNGYTLDATGALDVVKEIEPKLLIPTHYDEKGLNYPVPQQTLDQAVKGLGMEIAQKTQKLKLKPSELTDKLQLVVLERS
jgi:L-ascorbate metabolism protein UlaG (beta-lactamase superfamily)